MERGHDADPAAALALRYYQGRKRVHSADEIMAEIVAKQPAEHTKHAASDRRVLHDDE